MDVRRHLFRDHALTCSRLEALRLGSDIALQQDSLLATVSILLPPVGHLSVSTRFDRLCTSAARRSACMYQETQYSPSIRLAKGSKTESAAVAKKERDS